MLSFDTLSKIEQLLMSRSHPIWGEFMPLAQVIGEVQQEKNAVAMAMRAQPAPQPQQGLQPAPALVPNGAAE